MLFSSKKSAVLRDHRKRFAAVNLKSSRLRAGALAVFCGLLLTLTTSLGAQGNMPTSYNISVDEPVTGTVVVNETGTNVYTGSNTPILYAELSQDGGSWEVLIRSFGAGGLQTTVYELDSGSGPVGNYTEIGGSDTCEVGDL